MAGTETGNPTEVAGVVKDVDGNAVAGITVTLYPHDYIPFPHSGLAKLPAISLHSEVTDEHGRFEFSGMEAGTYNVLARDDDLSLAGIIQNIDVVEEERLEGLAPELQETGSLKMYLENISVEEGWYLYLQGTDVFIRLTARNFEQGYAVLDNIPSATWPAVRYWGSARQEVAIHNEEVLIEPAKTTVIGPYHFWAHRYKVSINTTPSGADVAENVFEFPVLLRLNSSSSPVFENTIDVQGADIRFTKSDGYTTLPYEIERWNSVGERAEIWVKTDTVYGNDMNQFIYMYTGMLAAPAASSGPSVFGSNGYSGVWHLQETREGIDNSNVYRNSAADNHHGDDFITAAEKQGVIARGASFVMEDYIVMENASQDFKPDTAFSISAWIKADTTDIGYSWVTADNDTLRRPGSEIVSMGNDFALRIQGDGKIRLYIFDDIVRPIPDSLLYNLESSDSGYLDNQWHQVTGEFNNSQMNLYIDGVLDTSMSVPFKAIAYEGGPHFFIGRHGDQEPEWDFQGDMDEVRLGKAAHSADWIKLSFENQKIGSNVVKIE